MSEVWTFGETMVSLRADERVRPGTVWTTHVAGAEANVAIGLSRLGHAVTWCGALGDDDFGRLVERELRAEGVGLDCTVDESRPTGFMFLQDKGFSRQAAYHRSGSAASALGAEVVVGSLERSGARIVVVTGITPALSDVAADAVRAVIGRAGELDATVVLDVNHRALLWHRDSAGAYLREVVPGVDVVVGSEDELALIAEHPEEILALGPSEVVVKLGSEGARLHHADGVVEAPTEPVEVKDPVGAGDAFVAGYVSGMLDGLGSEERLRRGNLMGGAAVRHVGDYEGLPTRAELTRLESQAAPDVLR